jgi:hypothetical protein
MTSRGIAYVREQVERHVAADQADKIAISKVLNALTDAAGEAAGKLQRQVNELKEQNVERDAKNADLQTQLNETKAANDELRGELTLLRGLAAGNRSAPRRILHGNNREQDEHASFN